MERALLYIVRSFGALWTSLGVDPEQMLQILSLKLTLARRRPRQLLNGRPGSKPGVWTPIFYRLGIGLLGAFSAIILYLVADVFTAFSLYLLFFMGLLGYLLLQDYQSDFLENKDPAIINPRPVSDRTLLAASLLYAGIQVIHLVLAISAAALIYVAYQYTWQLFLCFIATIFLATVMVLLLTNGVYLLFLRTLGALRFKKMLSMIQLLALLSVISLQLFGNNLLAEANVEELDFRSLSLSWLLPPVWLGAVIGLVQQGYSHLLMVLSLLALLVPLLGTWLSLRFLSLGFGNRLVEFSKSSMTTAPHTGRKAILPRFVAYICAQGEERAAFLLVWKLSVRSSSFKQQIYPGLGIAVIYLIYVYVQGYDPQVDIQQLFSQVREEGKYLLSCYLLGVSLQHMIKQLAYAEQFKSAWVFYIAPLTGRASLQSGMLKAILIRYYIPVLLLMGSFLVTTLGISLLNDIIMVGSISCILSILTLLFRSAYYPFSKPRVKEQAGILENLLQLTLMGSCCLVHYIIRPYESLVWLVAMLLLLVLIGMFIRLKRELLQPGNSE